MRSALYAPCRPPFQLAILIRPTEWPREPLTTDQDSFHLPFAIQMKPRLMGERCVRPSWMRTDSAATNISLAYLKGNVR